MESIEIEGRVFEISIQNYGIEVIVKEIFFTSKEVGLSKNDFILSRVTGFAGTSKNQLFDAIKAWATAYLSPNGIETLISKINEIIGNLPLNQINKGEDPGEPTTNNNPNWN